MGGWLRCRFVWLVVVVYETVLQSTTPLLLSTTQYHSNTTLYLKYYDSFTLFYKIQLQYHPRSTKYYFCTINVYYKVLFYAR